MADLSQIIQSAIFARLKETFHSREASIYDHTPAGEIDIRRPVIMIGEATATAQPSKGGTEARYLIEISIIGAGNGRALVHDLAGRALAALRCCDANSWRLPQREAILLGPLFDSRDDREIEPADVPVFATTLRFVVHAEIIQA